jgi:2-iminobutanoate/2-iminopropanoate deaminase
MLKVHNPNSIAAPLAPSYCHGMEVPPNARWLFTAGEVGVDASGAVVDGFEAQCRLVWTNIIEILRSADMSASDIVKMHAFVVAGCDMMAYANIRSEFLGDHKPTSAAIYVPALLKQELLIEVDVTAAKV